MKCLVGMWSVRLPVLDVMHTRGLSVSGTNLRSHDSLFLLVEDNRRKFQVNSFTREF